VTTEPQLATRTQQLIVHQFSIQNPKSQITGSISNNMGLLKRICNHHSIIEIPIGINGAYQFDSRDIYQYN